VVVILVVLVDQAAAAQGLELLDKDQQVALLQVADMEVAEAEELVQPGSLLLLLLLMAGPVVLE
jgi:hypothetical protein